MRPLFFICLLILMMGCSSSTNQKENQETDAMPDVEESMSFFGEKIEADAAISYDAMIAQLEGKDSLNTKVKGVVSEVCQAKGCWMNIVSEQPNVEPMMVRFKDYGFFVPKDISGRTVIMEGKAFRSVTSVDELKHYAEDKGASKEEIEEINEPKVETKFLASGVILLGEK